MTLRINFLGVDIARIDLELDNKEPAPSSVIDQGIKAVSRHWARSLFR